MTEIAGAPDDTVAWIEVGALITRGIYGHEAWWTDVDAGVSGNHHQPESVKMLQVLARSTDPARQPGDADGSAWATRLHAPIEDRRRDLGLTLMGIQSAGGPSPRWVQKLLHLAGPPTDRMRLPMRRLDLAIGWDVGTAWRIATRGER
ncbi:hypothetical protein [Terrabacter sp. NPDC080008]|uniref:hypothetical protein n=1 Tax=Terrabacter sp. NPDC080008 TaxID=3155176 RepID=UPI00344E6091